ncbi:efflux transporter outer membrane subunit [Variovorax saccharolyticus]|uniref:efflux transporter outer membrane subunit n=1 Tax=Variovorax saccharolyticus TaxID=3053516 RepID=UPI002575FB2E|nr:MULTISPECIES: efflux transporter outer membrane subunit [unclassified Variovorax]MDM0022718.1 efflux transporter outer membrane subunit [Variovorax sp. J22R187]MDM0028481.1 efflux transporter outer membrane subunit [Variovorax sp. J31P216]
MTAAQRPYHRLPVALALAALLAGCAVGPTYERPPVAAPAAWKSAPAEAGWQPAAPADAFDRGEWWKLFGDATLDELAARVQISNQNIAAAVANYAQAQALVRGQRAALFPQVTLDGSARRTGGRDISAATASAAALGVDWQPDVWGRLRKAVDSAQASAQASEADLAAARLSSVGELASNYFSLREADAELRILDDTLEGYERSLQITRNRYAASIAAQSDVLQAETLYANTRAERAQLKRSRDALEHAIAVLVGVAPADFSLPAGEWKMTVPGVPAELPSTLLERRPDIAAAERQVAAANAQIGIARSAYYPNFSLSGGISTSASRVGDLFNASNTLWSLGLSVAQVVFDAGAIGASVDAAKAGHEASVARYRQTVLAAFQSVEDQLTAGTSLAQQEVLRRESSAAADRTEQQFLNRYRAGTIDYTSVVVAQVSALNSRRTLLQVQVNRQLAAVTLIQTLGGGWHAEWMEPSPKPVAATAPARS